MGTRGRSLLALGLALGLHAPAALAIAAYHPMRPLASPPPSPASPDELVFVSVEAQPLREETVSAFPALPASAGRSSTPSETAPARGVAARAPSAPRTQEDHVATVSLDAPSIAAPASSSAIGLTRPAPPPSLDLAPADAYAVEPDTGAPVRPTTTATTTTAADSLRAALDDHDRRIGLGPEGPVAAVLHRVTMASRVPVGSAATLVATVDAAGNVIAIDVRSADRDPEAWKDVAADVLAAMHGKTIAVPAGAHGLRLGFSIESRSRSVSGHMKDTRSPVFVTPDNTHAERSPSLTFGTPQYRCLEGCTASANIDPTDALLNATSGPARTISVKTLPPQRVP